MFPTGSESLCWKPETTLRHPHHKITKQWRYVQRNHKRSWYNEESNTAPVCTWTNMATCANIYGFKNSQYVSPAPVFSLDFQKQTLALSKLFVVHVLSIHNSIIQCQTQRTHSNLNRPAEGSTCSDQSSLSRRSPLDLFVAYYRSTFFFWRLWNPPR